MKTKMLLVALGAAMSMNIALAQDKEKIEKHATRAEAVAMVKEGVATLKKDGKDKFIDEINTTDKYGRFMHGELYLIVTDMNGYYFANPFIKKMVGKNLIALKDVDGKEFVKERIELAKTKDSFWQDFRISDPVAKKVIPKSFYCEKAMELLVCGGISNTDKK